MRVRRCAGCRRPASASRLCREDRERGCPRARHPRQQAVRTGRQCLAGRFGGRADVEGRLLQVIALRAQPIGECRDGGPGLRQRPHAGMIAPVQRGKDRAGGARHTWIGQDQPEGRQCGNGIDHLAHAPHPGGAAFQADRHIGAQCHHVGGVGHLRSAQRGQRPQHRRRIRRAAAQPRGQRQGFRQPDGGGNLRHQASGPQGEIVGIRRQTVREGACEAQRSPRCCVHLHQVAQFGKHHQAVEQVIAVLPTAGDVQRQIDLGAGKLAYLSHCWRSPPARRRRPLPSAPRPGPPPACGGCGRHRPPQARS